MNIDTRIFGEIDVDINKVITFPSGIVGFPDLKDFALIYDEEKGRSTSIRWLQSIQEPVFALPVMDPLLVSGEYNPEVEDELLKPIGQWKFDELLVLVTVTVPKEVEQMSVNLKAPIVINAQERKACQVIADGDDYPVKYLIYDILQERKSAK